MARIGKWEVSDEELATEYQAAVEAGKRTRKHPLAIVKAEYLADQDALYLVLKSGVAVEIPVAKIDELKGAPASQKTAVKVSPLRDTLMWEALDIYISARGLLADLCGLVDPAEQARRAGSVTSEAKRAAVRENGKKGGRPKKAV
ncbi:MAG: DUF2442 domain-containing protein [Candidatus Sericytochromatia bacterium]|nr:DUF2442 domain-containing protein [Candidatus Tanganyikabacteria bacterium]